MAQTPIVTDRAPGAIGPYSQAIKVGSLLFSSGQIGTDPVTGKMAEGGIESQTKRALANLEAVVQAGGGSIENIVKTTIFVKDLNHFEQLNKIYGAFFGNHRPARSTVEVARLPKDALIEIECVAHME